MSAEELRAAAVPAPVRAGDWRRRSPTCAPWRRPARGEEREVALPQGHTVRLRELPVRRAAVYVPGGRAPYPSTVVMGAITAQVAGVEEVVVCSPGGQEGRPRRVRPVRRGGGLPVGGAHAVAALAYGTDSVAPVDVIVGPGNAWVTEAKRQVFGQVGIDGLAGPSELAVLCEDPAPRGWSRWTCGAQAEHGARQALVMAISHQRARSSTR